jgi:hypothetical protein
MRCYEIPSIQRFCSHCALLWRPPTSRQHTATGLYESPKITAPNLLAPMFSVNALVIEQFGRLFGHSYRVSILRNVGSRLGSSSMPRSPRDHALVRVADPARALVNTTPSGRTDMV